MRRLCLFHKIFNLKSPKYVHDLILSVTRFYTQISHLLTAGLNILYILFPNVIKEMNKLDIKITNIASHKSSKIPLLSIIRKLYFDAFSSSQSCWVEYVTKTLNGSFHLNEHKLKHNFHVFINLLCVYYLEPETTSHYLLRYHIFQIRWRTLFNNIKEIQ